MAMYEREGYCPNNAFFHYVLSRSAIFEDKNSNLRRIYDVLGDRKGYMVYAEKAFDRSFFYSSIVEACLSDWDFGLEAAYYLKTLVPECVYAEKGKKIVIYDVFSLKGLSGKKITGEKFQAIIEDGKEEVHIYLMCTDPSRKLQEA